MLFHSSLRKELARSFGATLVVLTTIVMTIMLVRTLGQASRGSVNPSEVVQIMGFTVLGHLPTLLTLSLFVSIVATLSRMYADSEMVIWFSSGRGLASFLSPLLQFAWPILLGITVLALLVWPWSNQQINDLRTRYEQRGDIERVAPGQFQESADGTRVFFMDKDAPDKKSGTNIFISAHSPESDSVITAHNGHIEVLNGDRFLLLNNGQRLENTPQGALDLKLSEFQTYGIRLKEDVLATQDELPAKSRSTLNLLQNPTNVHLGELGWRLGLALAAANLVVIALAVSSVNPRVGRSGNLIFALLAFVVYYNMINLGQSWIAAGKVSLPVFLVELHGGTFLLAMVWMARRHHNGSLRSFLQWRGVRASGARP